VDQAVLECEGAHPLALRLGVVDMPEVVFGSIPLLFLGEGDAAVVVEVALQRLARSSSGSAAGPPSARRAKASASPSRHFRHVKLLEEAGVVTRVIDGRNHRLGLRPETLADAAEWIENQRTRWERLFDVVGEYLEERR
jgi:hypothetical protein